MKVMVAMIAAEILATFEITMVYAALRYLVQDFGSPDAVGWAITSFFLASAVSAAICGRLGDMYDRKLVLLIVIALSITGSLIAGLSSSLTGVVVGRTIQGSAGAILPLCIGILRANVDARSLPMFVGVLTAIMTVSAGLGLLVGGLLVDYLTWHWIFYVTAAVGVFAWIAVYLLLPSGVPGRPVPGTNFLGGVLFAPGLVCLMLALTKGQAWGWASWPILGLAGGGALLLFAWIRSEMSARVPLLNIRLVLDREIAFAFIATILFGLTWMQFAQVWSLLLQQPTVTGVGLGLSASMAGLIMQPQTFVALVGGPLAGWLMVRHGVRFSMALGGFVLGGSWMVAMVKHDTIPMVLLLMIILGVSSAYLVAAMTTIVARAAPEHRTSEAIGIMAVLRTIASSIGALIVFHLLGSSTVTGPDGGELPDRLAYLMAMGYIAAGLTLIGVLYAALYRPRTAVD